MRCSLPVILLLRFCRGVWSWRTASGGSYRYLPMRHLSGDILRCFCLSAILTTACNPRTLRSACRATIAKRSLRIRAAEHLPTAQNAPFSHTRRARHLRITRRRRRSPRCDLDAGAPPGALSAACCAAPGRCLRSLPRCSQPPAPISPPVVCTTPSGCSGTNGGRLMRTHTSW